MNGVDVMKSHEAIDAIQAAVERQPQIDLPLRHQFSHGMYIRTIFIPKNVILVGKVHRFEHPFVVTKGRMLVYDVFTGAKEISAGHLGISKSGTRRFAYAYEDTEWTTFHATLKTDLKEIEFELIEERDFNRDEAYKTFVEKIAKGKLS